MNSVSSLAKASNATRLYFVLHDNFNLSHWMIRSILIQRLGFTKEQVKVVMKKQRRRIREQNAKRIDSIIAQTSHLPYDEQVKVLRLLQHADSIEWVIMSDVIRRLNAQDPANRRRRWSKFNSLRQSEVKEGLRRYDEQLIGAWLRIEGHAPPVIMSIS